MAYLKSTSAYVYDNLNAPQGTKMAFQQTTAPLNWTKQTASNDVGLRLVSGTVGTGGTVAFDTAFASKTPTITMTNAAVTLTIANLAVHNHPVPYDGNQNNADEWTEKWSTVHQITGIGPRGSDTSHTHSNTSASAAIDLNVSYVDVIIATKD